MQENILTTLVLPIALAMIILGLGLSLKGDDFSRIFKYPKAVTIGLIGQLVILPVIAVAIVKVIPMPPAIDTVLLVLLCWRKTGMTRSKQCQTNVFLLLRAF
jgi:BASS family bile acid:Na+ symporter